MRPDIFPPGAGGGGELGHPVLLLVYVFLGSHRKRRGRGETYKRKRSRVDFN